MLHANRLTPALGAELVGLTADVLRDPKVGETLYKELIEHQVVFIRDADLGPGEMVRLGRDLGTLAARHHHYRTHPDHDDVVVLEWGADNRPDSAEWHSDLTYREQPPFASILKAIQLPPLGGDTLWASMYAVHDALPEGLRSDIAELHAVHDMGAFRTPAYRDGGNDGINAAMAATGQAAQPMIAVHPVSGRRYLNVSESFTRFIIGLNAAESARLLTLLFDFINRPDFHVRLKWEPNTIAIWDNRGTQHYAVADYMPHTRIMHRVVVQTDDRLAPR